METKLCWQGLRLQMAQNHDHGNCLRLTILLHHVPAQAEDGDLFMAIKATGAKSIFIYGMDRDAFVSAASWNFPRTVYAYGTFDSSQHHNASIPCLVQDNNIYIHCNYCQWSLLQAPCLTTHCIHCSTPINCKEP